MQDRTYVGNEVCRTGRMQHRTDAGQAGCRGGHNARLMQYREDAAWDKFEAI